MYPDQISRTKDAMTAAREVRFLDERIEAHKEKLKVLRGMREELIAGLVASLAGDRQTSLLDPEQGAVPADDAGGDE